MCVIYTIVCVYVYVRVSVYVCVGVHACLYAYLLSPDVDSMFLFQPLSVNTVLSDELDWLLSG